MMVSNNSISYFYHKCNITFLLNYFSISINPWRVIITVTMNNHLLSYFKLSCMWMSIMVIFLRTLLVTNFSQCFSFNKSSILFLKAFVALVQRELYQLWMWNCSVIQKIRVCILTRMTFLKECLYQFLYSSC